MLPDLNAPIQESTTLPSSGQVELRATTRSLLDELKATTRGLLVETNSGMVGLTIARHLGALIKEEHTEEELAQLQIDFSDFTRHEGDRAELPHLEFTFRDKERPEILRLYQIKHGSYKYLILTFDVNADSKHATTDALVRHNKNMKDWFRIVSDSDVLDDESFRIGYFLHLKEDKYVTTEELALLDRPNAYNNAVFRFPPPGKNLKTDYLAKAFSETNSFIIRNVTQNTVLSEQVETNTPIQTATRQITFNEPITITEADLSPEQSTPVIQEIEISEEELSVSELQVLKEQVQFALIKFGDQSNLLGYEPKINLQHMEDPVNGILNPQLTLELADEFSNYQSISVIDPVPGTKTLRIDFDNWVDDENDEVAIPLGLELVHLNNSETLLRIDTDMSDRDDGAWNCAAGAIFRFTTRMTTERNVHAGVSRIYDDNGRLIYNYQGINVGDISYRELLQSDSDTLTYGEDNLLSVNREEFKTPAQFIKDAKVVERISAMELRIGYGIDESIRTFQSTNETRKLQYTLLLIRSIKNALIQV